MIRPRCGLLVVIRVRVLLGSLGGRLLGGRLALAAFLAVQGLLLALDQCLFPLGQAIEERVEVT